MRGSKSVFASLPPAVREKIRAAEQEAVRNPRQYEYDKARLRVRAADELQLTSLRGLSAKGRERASLAAQEQRQLIEHEQQRTRLRCELCSWQLEAEHREARIRELRCSRELQAALHGAERAGTAGGGPDAAALRTVHQQTLRLTRRLTVLEDERAALIGSEACVRALEANRRIDELARRGDELRAQLAQSHVVHSPAAELLALGAAHAQLEREAAAAREVEQAETSEADARLGLVSAHATDLSDAVAVLLQERGQRLAEERELLVGSHRARRAAERALQVELEALRPEIDISKGELGRLLLSSSAADGTVAQQAAELTSLGAERERVVVDEQRLRGEVVGLRGRAEALTEALEAAEVKLTEARRAEEAQRQKLLGQRKGTRHVVAEEKRAPSASSVQLPQPAARAAARRAPRSPAATAEAGGAAPAAPLTAVGAGEKAKAKVEFSAKDQARLEELRAKLGDPLGRGAA